MACENCTCGAAAAERTTVTAEQLKEAQDRADRAEQLLRKLQIEYNATNNSKISNNSGGRKLRSREWFDNAHNPGMHF